MSGPYSKAQLLNKIKEAPADKTDMPIYHVGTCYAALTEPSYYRNCREETFGNLMNYDWGWYTPGITIKPWGNELWSFYLYTSVPVGSVEEFQYDVIASKLANVSETLAKVEKELKFKRHSFVIDKRNYNKDTNVFVVKTKGIFSSRWRYSPALLFLLLSLLRDTEKKNSSIYYMNLSTIKAIKKHGIKKIFGANMSIQRAKGRTYQAAQGIQYFEGNELPQVITKLEGKEEARKMARSITA